MSGSAATPRPERDEPILHDPGLTDLSGGDWKAIVVRAGKKLFKDNLTDVAAALAYYAFLAIPATLLIAVGVFTLVADANTIESMMTRLEGVVPEQTIELLRDSLNRAIENSSGGLVLVVVGFLLALWTTSGAMNALMRGLNRVYDREETRGFVRQRGTALTMLACLLLAFALAFGLLVFGSVIAKWLGGALGAEGFFGWIWWTAQWPILLVGLMLAFAAILYLGPNVDHPRWSPLTLGSAVAVVIWLVASGLFAVYVSMFSSYNKAWGSLAAVIIMLTWLWLSALAILLGAAINAEVERSRQLRQGKPAAEGLRAPAKA